MKPHKHAEVIKAWADGAKIEYRNNNMKDWDDMPECSPLWFETVEYRIKPEPKPDVVQYFNITQEKGIMFLGYREHKFYLTPSKHNLKLTFDGVSGHLKKAEVL